MNQDKVDRVLKQWAKERPDLDTSAMGVVGRISRASRYFDQYLQKNFARFELNQGEFDVLATLRRSGPPFELTPKDLLNALMLTSGAMTNRLDRLESAGHIERKAHPTDRRGVLVKLTTKGHTTIDKAVAAHADYELQLLSPLSTAEQQQLAALMRKLLISFGDQISDEDVA